MQGYGSPAAQVHQQCHVQVGETRAPGGLEEPHAEHVALPGQRDHEYLPVLFGWAAEADTGQALVGAAAGQDRIYRLGGQKLCQRIGGGIKFGAGVVPPPRHQPAWPVGPLGR